MSTNGPVTGDAQVTEEQKVEGILSAIEVDLQKGLVVGSTLAGPLATAGIFTQNTNSWVIFGITWFLGTLAAAVNKTSGQ